MPPAAEFIAAGAAEGASAGSRCCRSASIAFPFLPKVGDWNRFCRQHRRHDGREMLPLLRPDASHHARSEAVRVYCSGAMDVNHLDEALWRPDTPDIHRQQLHHGRFRRWHAGDARSVDVRRRGREPGRHHRCWQTTARLDVTDSRRRRPDATARRTGFMQPQTSIERTHGRRSIAKALAAGHPSRRDILSSIRNSTRRFADKGPVRGHRERRHDGRRHRRRRRD